MVGGIIVDEGEGEAVVGLGIAVGIARPATVGANETTL
jgi:hypothetical protein